MSLLLGWLSPSIEAQVQVYNPSVRTFTARVNDEQLTPTVLQLGNNEQKIIIRFDELSRSYHRFEYQIRHCNADWTPSSINEIDYLVGFNGNRIENYTPSLNTTLEYSHYVLTVPNEQVSLKCSGNYEVLIYDTEDNTYNSPDSPSAIARFSMLDNRVPISAEVTTNTDIDLNKSHQQVNFTANYRALDAHNPQTELSFIVRQNQSEKTQATNLKPTFITGSAMQFEHNRALIFAAGNEYRRFEILSHYHYGMGISQIQLYGDYYHAELYTDKPRRKYIFDKDQNGSFLIRNDDSNTEDVNTEADYLFVHFSFDPDDTDFSNGSIYLDGDFTHSALPYQEATNDGYRMEFNPQTKLYENIQLLKQGSYNYQYIYQPNQGTITSLQQLEKTEGNFYQTSNTYQIYVYYRPFGARYDALVGFLEIK